MKENLTRLQRRDPFNEYKNREEKDETKYTIIDNQTTIFTDGSLIEQRAGAGVFFGKDNALNTGIRVNGEQEVMAGELLAIDYAIEKGPIKNILIITNNKATIQMIENAKEGWIKQKESKTKHRSTIQRLVKNIKEREGKGHKINIQHIYSHIEEKLTQGTEEENKQWEQKIEQMKKTYGENWELCMQGNQKANYLAKEATKQKKENQSIYKGTDEVIILNKEREVLETNIYKHIQTISENEMKDKLWAKKKRGEAWRSGEIDQKISTSITESNKVIDAKHADYIHK